MKNLANCNPREFLVQTNRIRKVAAEFLKKTDILGLKDIAKDIGGKSRDDAEKEVEKRLVKNFSDTLDKMLETDVDKTVELLCLCFFLDPARYEEYKMSDFLNGIVEMLEDSAVISFFTSLARLIPKDILTSLSE